MIKAIRRYYKPGIKVLEKDPGSNDIGGWKDNYKLKEEIQGLLRPLKGEEHLISDKLVSRSTHVLYCDIHDIKQDDRIEYKELQYTISFINNVMDMDNHLQVYLRVSK